MIIQRIIRKKSKLKNFLILIEDVKSEFALEKNGNSFVADNSKLVQNGQSLDFDVRFRVLTDPTPDINSTEGIEGFTSLFRSRYKKMLRIFSMRSNAKGLKKIAQVKENIKGNSRKVEDNKAESIFLSGLILSKRVRRNDIEIVIDDMTGTLNFSLKEMELKKKASLLVLDQMIMLEGSFNRNNKGRFDVRDLVYPDIPDHIANKSNSEIYAVLISDLHIGSRYFMEEAYMRFIEWLDSDDEIASKVKFICIAGDIIDGIGIFPNQDKELVDMSTEGQLLRAVKLLDKIPQKIHVFVIPGNHDPGRRSLPQGSMDIEALQLLNNFSLLGNPSLIELNDVKVLMFHGQSLDDIIASIPNLSYSKPAEAMKYLLKMRHLSPIYGSRTPLAPEEQDMLVIEDVPDIFHSGHVHVVDVNKYKSTLIVNSGAWQSQTKYQRTMGIVPTPGIAIVVNLATLGVFQKKFIT
jgi:DNA polymerase II small subunit